MVMIKIFLLCIWLLGMPLLAGGLFVPSDRTKGQALPRGTRKVKELIFRWFSGQVCLWAGFQLVCTPLILLQKDYLYLRIFFAAFCVALSFWGLAFSYRSRRKSRLHLVPEKEEAKKETWIAWGVFLVLLAFQLIQAVRMTYADGDDAYYVALSTTTENASTMYQKIPYTGESTSLDLRHGLAPFPVWIAFLASMSGIRTVSVAHVAVPFVLIAMTYGIFYLLGERLFAKNREALPVFMSFTALLVLFGDYSFYTAENFMIARSRQGKAALGNIVIPVLLFLFLVLLEKMQAEEKPGIRFWILLCAAMTAACLCSTLGALLACMLAGVVGLCAAVCCRRFKVLFPIALCCAPCVGFVLLYLVL